MTDEGGGVRRHVPPRSQAELPTGLAIDQFTQDVGVPGVSRRFLEQVHQDPAEVAGDPSPTSRHRSSRLRWSRTTASMRRQPSRYADTAACTVSSGVTPSSGVSASRPAKRLRIHRDSARAMCFTNHRSVVRYRRGSPGSVLIDSLDLPNQGLALVLQECLHGGELILVESRRLPIRHR